MKKTLFTALIILIGLLVSNAQTIESDSIKILNLANKVSEIEKVNSQLTTMNENLQSSLELTNIALNDFLVDKKLSDKTKWEKIKSNVKTGVKTYEILNSDIINLKSTLINEDYQNYIKSLSSVKDGPLGFSFEDVIINTATDINLYTKKSKLEKFLDITKSVINSPIISNLPYVSNAVNVSNSVLDIAYSATFTERKTDLTKFKKFEIELNRYISYYVALDKANLSNQSSNSEKLLLLNNLQFDLLNNLKKDALRLKYTLRERKPNETIDSYLNFLISEFNTDFAQKYFDDIESKYEDDNGEINYNELLKKELDVKYFNNNIGVLISIAKKYNGYYDNYFEISDDYQIKVIGALDIAKENKIIVGKDGKTEIQVYKEIMNHLSTKKGAKDDIIKNSINIDALLKQVNFLESESVKII
jgi:hypothetical protein